MQSNMLSPKLFKLVQNKQNSKIYHIDPILIPYLFNFSSRVLVSCKLSEQTISSNLVASEMFSYLKEKILPKRKYSKTGRMPTRMKAQEKIKFIMRCLEYNLAKIYNRPAAKLTNFNFQEQKKFFNRTDVRKHFLEEMPRIIQEKQAQNLQKIKEMEALIISILNESKKNQKQAQRMFQKVIKQKQLPWSVDMFKDIQLFCKDIYHNFIQKPTKTNQKSINSKYNRQQLPKINEVDQIDLDGDQWLQECIVKTNNKKFEQDVNESESTNNSELKTIISDK